jgi:hypothetical protein
LYRNICIHIQYICTLQVRMSTSGVIIHYIGWGCQSPNPQEIHCCKWEFCVRFAHVFQEHIPVVKWDLSVLTFGAVSKMTAGWNMLDMISMIFMPNFINIWISIYKNGKELVYWSDFDPGLYCLGSILPIDFSSSILSLSLLTSLNFGFDVHFFFIRNPFLAFDLSDRLECGFCKNS